MKNGPKAFMGAGPWIGRGALNQRGKNVNLRMGSLLYLPATSSVVASIVAPQGAGYGIAFDTVGNMFFVNASTAVSCVSGNGLAITQSSRLGFSTGAASSTFTTFFTSQAAAVMQQGLDAATPVHQALKAHNATASSDAVGANKVTAGGAGASRGRGGDVINKTHESTSVAGGAGTVVQTASTTPRYQAVAKYVTLTEASATVLCHFLVGSGKIIGMVVDAVVHAYDNTNLQVLTSRLVISACNPGAGITATIVQTDGSATNSSGTLTPVTYTVVDAGSGILHLKCNATSSLTQTILECRFVIVSYSGNSVEAITATTLIVPQ